MKFQWSIQSSHTQIALSQVTYLTNRNEHIWPLTKVFTLIEIFSFGFHFSYFLINTTQFFEQWCREIFYISLKNKPLALASYISNTFLLHIFLVKLVFEIRFFQLFLFLEIDVCRVFWHKNKCEEIYRIKSTHVLRSNKTIG